MARQLAPIDISDQPELLRLAEEVQATQQPRLLRHKDEDLAILTPATTRRRRKRGGPVTRDDPLFGLIGIGRSGIEGGVAERKHEFLAQAYRNK
jgi:hypothetical protein